MSSPIRLKRRLPGGAAGAPAALKTAEVAINMADNVVYAGFGDDGNGNATNVVPIAGKGAFSQKSENETISGDKTFTGVVTVQTPTASAHAATKQYVDNQLSNAAQTGGDGITVSNGVVTVDGSVARLTGADFTGTVTASTATAADSSTKVATTAFVAKAIQDLVGASPESLDTLAEIATAINNDASLNNTINQAIAAKTTKTANLSDLADVVQARANLGLGSIATQAANAVAITGGSMTGGTIGADVIINAPLDGGSF